MSRSIRQFRNWEPCRMTGLKTTWSSDSIQTRENEINAYKERLCHIRKRKEIEAESNRPLEKAMASLNRMHERLGVIGENQISYIAGSNKLEFYRLKDECEKKGMNIVPFSEVPKYWYFVFFWESLCYRSTYWYVLYVLIRIVNIYTFFIYFYFILLLWYIYL